MKYIMALDQGTTSSRTIIFDHSGNMLASAQQEFEQHFPKPGWVEHDASEIWSTQLSTAVEALSKADLSPEDVAGIGITNQRETTVVWDRESGKPIYRAIVWQDRRTAGACRALREAGHDETFRAKTGLVLDAYFSGTKVAWILDNVEGARELAEAGRLAFGTIDSWLVYKLTNGSTHITDASNASRTLLYNIHTGKWDEELLGLLNIPASMLPEVRPSSEVYATVSNTHLGGNDVGIPIAGIAGDQQAALFGQMCTEPGMAKNTYGTGCFMLLHTGDKAVASENNLLTTVAWQLGDKIEYALEGSVFIGGAVVQWLRDGLNLIQKASEVEALAREVEDTGDVYLVPAFSGLGAPYWDPHARGTIVGITRGTTKGHIARAALESIALQVADLMNAMKNDSGLDLAELRVDGGAAANNLLMQMQADLLQSTIVRPTVVESTARGAAFLAGLAVGYWKDLDEIASTWEIDRKYQPEMPADLASSKTERWAQATQRALDWAKESQ